MFHPLSILCLSWSVSFSASGECLSALAHMVVTGSGDHDVMRMFLWRVLLHISL